MSFSVLFKNSAPLTITVSPPMDLKVVNVPFISVVFSLSLNQLPEMGYGVLYDPIVSATRLQSSNGNTSFIFLTAHQGNKLYIYLMGTNCWSSAVIDRHITAIELCMYVCVCL